MMLLSYKGLDMKISNIYYKFEGKKSNMSSSVIVE